MRFRYGFGHFGFAEGDFINNMDANKELGIKSKASLEQGDLDEFGRLMHEQWVNKRSRQADMSNAKIDDIYAAGLANGGPPTETY